jgi:hypothetical protein
MKILWIRSPGSADVTIRGTRLDGAEEARFGQSTPPEPQLALGVQDKGPNWHGYPSTVRSQTEHGCFAFTFVGVDEPRIVADFGS